jgi:hypothetical protein
MEVSFFVSDDALMQIQPSPHRDEASLLSAFDTNRELIYAAAAKVYGRGHKGSYNVTPSDF